MKRKTITQSAVMIAIVLLIGLALFAKKGVYESVPYEKTEVLMDTFVTIKAFGSDKEMVEEGVGAAFAEIKRLDELMSFYSKESEVAAINEVSGQRFVRVSFDTFELISLSLDVSRKSLGAFDPTVGSIEHLWDFVEKRRADPSELAAAVALVGYEGIELDEDKRAVRLKAEGAKIDLGGVAKGYALDRAADILRDNGIESALLTMGSTTKVIGVKADGKPWKVGIQNPRFAGDGSLVGVLSLDGLALSTSGDYQRYFEEDGIRLHHILDPKTGMPAEGLMSASVIGEITAAEADALSTAVFVMGNEKGLEFLESDDQIEGILVLSDGSVKITSGLEGRVQELKDNAWD
ncbi:MAG: FAD:protein FMN transferase [Actinomycetota bacterium]|nr:FAD:protein FMN transferase [Actinomycetota bacterium]